MGDNNVVLLGENETIEKKKKKQTEKEETCNV